jgi:aryl-alcohol dehydrogenase
MKIAAAVVPARGQPFEIQELELAPPRAGEVLVEIIASGMCHTDLHARDGYFPNLPYPVVPGHEGAGIIAELGAGVTDLAVGDKVVISFPFCGECEPCRAEHPAYCTEARALKSSGRRADGFTPMSRDGAPVYSCFFQQSSFATHAVAPAKDVVRLRADAPVELLGPLGCGLQTGAGAVLNVMRPHAGQSIAVFGVGGVGLAGLMAAKIAGCDPVIAVDVHEHRLALARELGATHLINHTGRTDVVTEIRKITGRGVRFSLETSAMPAVFREAIESLMPAGTCILLGSARKGSEVTFEMPFLQEGRIIRGVIQGDSLPQEFLPKLVDLVVEERFPVAKMITFYDLADINRAAAESNSGKTIKPVLRMPHERH